MKDLDKDRKIPWIGLGTLLCVVAVMHVLTSWSVKMPIVWTDETGYLINAAAVAGFRLDGASSYTGGYSLLIAPGFLVSGDPVTIYRLVQAINLALCLLAVICLFNLQQILFSDAPSFQVWLSVAVAALYPAPFIYSSVAMSENAIIPLFTLCALCCVLAERRGGRWWILWAACLGFLFIVHPRTLPVTAAGWIVGGLIAWKKKEWGVFAAFVAISASLLAFHELFIQGWLRDRLSVGGMPMLPRYRVGEILFAALSSPEKIWNVAARVGGQLFYVFVATLGLAWIPFLAVVRGLWFERRNLRQRCRQEQPLLAVSLFLTLSLVGTMGLSSLMFEGMGVGRLDHWMYGRYCDALMMPLLAIGFLIFEKRTYLMAAVLGGVCAVAVHFAIDANAVRMNFNIVSLWQDYLLREQSPVVWWLVSALMGLAIAILPRIARAGAYILFFLVCVFMTWQKVLLPSADSNNFITRIPDFIRRYYDRKVQVGHETDLTDLISFEKLGKPNADAVRSLWLYRMYGFLLFDHGFRRVALENWRESGVKLLLSGRRDLNRLDSDLRLLEVSNQPYPCFLWSDKSEARGLSVMTPGTVVKMGSRFGDRMADVLLGQGWHSNDAEGLWSTDHCELLIPVEEASREKQLGLEILFWAFHATKSTPKTVRVDVEGSRVGTWTLTSEELQKKVIPLPFEALAHGDQEFRIEIKIDGAESPISVGLNADVRTLGLWISEMSLISLSTRRC